MIKILHTSDWHIDQLSKWSTWKSKKVRIEWISDFTQYHLDKIWEMVDYAIKNKINFFVFAWDMFHDSLSNHREKDIIFKELVKFINKLVDNKIYSIFLSWNHDLTRRIKEESKTNTLELFYNIDYKDYLFVNDPYSKDIEYKDYKIWKEDIRFILFPYLRVNISKKEVKEKITSLLKDNQRNILVWHLDIFWALYNWLEIQNLDLKDVNTWKTDELEALEVDLTLLWHVHNHQVLWNLKSVVYCGSPFRLSFNEEGVEKWFYIHFLDKEIKSKFTLLENKLWKTFDYDLSKTKGSFLELLEELKVTNLKDSIIRIVIKNIEKKDYKYIPYKEIRDLLNEKDIFYFKGYTYKEKISKLDQLKTLKLEKENDNWEYLDKELEPKSILKKTLKDDLMWDDFIEKSLNELNNILLELESK